MCALGEAARAAATATADRLAAAGYRVLAVATGPIAQAHAAAADGAVLQGLAFLGLVGLIDPVRPEVPEAIERCHASGVAVRMVTGDHPATALAIARQLGIAEAADAVVTGAELTALAADTDAQRRRIADARVFARVEPTQKLAIVEALRACGHFVAVTGDGVNDAPALTAAHIGVAMGRGGTDVARSAADLILTDDNFASIVAGIEEGRIAYDNVRKVTWLLISTGVGEIVLFCLALLAGLPIPLFAVQLLWLNLVTNGIQHVALAFEKGEPGVLARKPRPPDQPLFDRRMIRQTVLAGGFIGVAGFAFFYAQLAAGVGEAEARTGLLLLMVLFENVHVFNARSERRSVLRVPFVANPFVIVSVAAALTLHVGAMYTPGLNTVLDIAPIDFSAVLLAVPVALGLLAVVELYKLVCRARDTVEFRV